MSKPFYISVSLAVLIDLLIIGKLSSQDITNLRLNKIERGSNLISVLKLVESSYNLKFYYRLEDLDALRLKKSYSNITLEFFFTEILPVFGFTHSLYREKYVVILPSKLKDTTKPEVITIGKPSSNTEVILKGRITSAQTGEPLIGAYFLLKGRNKGVVADKNGEYEIILSKQTHDVEVSFLGMQTENFRLKVQGNGLFDIELFNETQQLEAIVVTDQRENANVLSTTMSSIKLTSKTIKEIPALLGEPDVIRAIQLLPGVSTVGEGASGFNVRGGNVDQNLILIDGAPIYNTSHVFGFFSAVNTESIQNFRLYKGGLPSKYGGRTSSVLELNMDEGDRQDFSFKGNVGTTSSNAVVQGPIIPDRASFLVSGRISYLNWAFDAARDIDVRNSSASYNDVSSKLSFLIGKKHKFNITGYLSNDQAQLSDELDFEYSNRIVASNWTTAFNQNLSAEFTASISSYENDVRDNELTREQKVSSGIQALRLSALIDGRYRNHTINLGGDLTSYSIQPGERIPDSQESAITPLVLDEQNSEAIGIFIEDEFRVNTYLTLTLGVRYAIFRNLGPASVPIYNEEILSPFSQVTETLQFSDGEAFDSMEGLEPRFSLRWLLGPTSSVKFNYQRTQQFLHLISNTVATDPFAYWYSSNRYIRPQQSDQWAFGYFRNVSNNQVELSAEVYYKQNSNAIDYRGGMDLSAIPNLELETLSAEERAYGIEFLIKKTTGRLNGWLALTLSRTERQIEGDQRINEINSGEYFPSNFDRPIDFSSFINYEFSRRWKLGANFSYSTGRPVSFPDQRFDLDGVEVVRFSERNNFRIPDYHRLDVSLTFEGNLKRKKLLSGSWTFSVYNLYGRRNPFSVFFGRRALSDPLFTPYQISILARPFPSLTYSLTIQ
ncbi:MAG: carboxypeptidase-like regulatory domain-containing protein [Bacteroidota bacterium]